MRAAYRTVSGHPAPFVSFVAPASQPLLPCARGAVREWLPSWTFTPAPISRAARTDPPRSHVSSPHIVGFDLAIGKQSPCPNLHPHPRRVAPRSPRSQSSVACPPPARRRLQRNCETSLAGPCSP